MPGTTTTVNCPGGKTIKMTRKYEYTTSNETSNNSGSSGSIETTTQVCEYFLVTVYRDVTVNTTDGGTYTYKQVLDTYIETECQTVGLQDDFNQLSANTGSDPCDALNDDVGVFYPNAEALKKLKILDEELLQDSTLLINIPCAQLKIWQETASHKPTQSEIDKINFLKESYPSLAHIFTGTFLIQNLEDGAGSVLNMDYFSVNLTQLPNGFTAESFLTHIRKNINTFIDSNLASFSPYDLYDDYPFNEDQIWNSDNPLGSIIHIDIPLPAGDGSVICTKSDSDSWIFTTIAAPYDWNHPVSGNREFGFERNVDGTLTFYTRGVDRITSPIENWIGNNFVENQFAEPDKLWKSFQDNIVSFVNQNGGQALANQPVIGRPDWDKISKFIQGEISIDELGCND